MTLDQMIEVLTAAKNGEAIEYKFSTTVEWQDCKEPQWNFDYHDYRIAPKEGLSLVDHLLEYRGIAEPLMRHAAARIEELESAIKTTHKLITNFTAEELMDELKRRMK